MRRSARRRDLQLAFELGDSRVSVSRELQIAVEIVHVRRSRIALKHVLKFLPGGLLISRQKMESGAAHRPIQVLLVGSQFLGQQRSAQARQPNRDQKLRVRNFAAGKKSKLLQR